MTIHLPPLRARSGDILLLAQHFAEQLGKKYNKNNLIIRDSVKSVISGYHWPGNIRQLRNVIEQAVMLCDGQELKLNHIIIPETGSDKNSSSESPPSTLPSQVRDETRRHDTKHTNDTSEDFTLQGMEKSLVERTLRKVDGNVSKCARLLGISRDQLRYRIKKYELNQKSGDPDRS